MPWFRVLMSFNQQARGWTEEYYRQADNLPAAADFSSVPGDFAVNFRNILTVHRQTRVNALDGSRQGIVKAVNQNGSSTGGPGDLGPEVAAVAWVWTLNAGVSGYKRKVWLRGLSDGDVERDPSSGEDAPRPTLVNGAKQYFANLISLGMGVRFLLPRVGQNIEVPIINVAQAAGEPQNTVITAQGSIDGFLAAGDLVNIYLTDRKSQPGLRGIYQVLRLFGTTAIIVPYRLPVVGPVSNPGAYFRKVTYDFGLITDPQPFGFRTRDTGRPTDLARGRRRGVSLRH